MAKAINHKKNIAFISIITWIILAGISYYFFPRFESINYYNLILEFIISCIALYLLYSIQPFKNIPFYNTLAVGYYLLFVSYFVDSIDQIFIHSIVYTVVMEKITLITSFVFIFIGTKKWMKIYQKIALTDDLTQLPNRKLVKQILSTLIKKCKKNPSVFSLVIIDIDFFKKINDQHGHYYGDKILSQFANLINSSLNKNEILGRWGGEEFVLIKKNTDKKTALVELESLRKTIEKHPFKLDEESVKLTASFGVSDYKCTQQDFKGLFMEADKAMYNAKNSGRNRIR
jgi:diguanylate cyclase (GGDEF)-like protein